MNDYRLSALVAEKVFGRVVAWSGNFAYCPERLPKGALDKPGVDLVGTAHMYDAVVPDYATDGIAMWELWRHLRSKGYGVAVAEDNQDTIATVRTDAEGHHFTSASSPARALCIAALKAYGVEVEV